MNTLIEKNIHFKITSIVGKIEPSWEAIIKEGIKFISIHWFYDITGLLYILK